MTPQIFVASFEDLTALVIMQLDESNRVGFLTFQALRDYVEDGAVWIAWGTLAGQQRPVGYLISPIPKRHLAAESLQPIIQCVVAAPHRRQGIASALLECVEYDARVRGSVGLQARCRADLQANSFWAAQGFIKIDQEHTRTARGHAINVWRKPLQKRIPHWFAFRRLRSEPKPADPGGQ